MGDEDQPAILIHTRSCLIWGMRRPQLMESGMLGVVGEALGG
ncbi:hypothetical protein [Roseicyclus sp.]